MLAHKTGKLHAHVKRVEGVKRILHAQPILCEQWVLHAHAFFKRAMRKMRFTRTCIFCVHPIYLRNAFYARNAFYERNGLYAPNQNENDL